MAQEQIAGMLPLTSAVVVAGRGRSAGLAGFLRLRPGKLPELVLDPQEGPEPGASNQPNVLFPRAAESDSAKTMFDPPWFTRVPGRLGRGRSAVSARTLIQKERERKTTPPEMRPKPLPLLSRNRRSQSMKKVSLVAQTRWTFFLSALMVTLSFALSITYWVTLKYRAGAIYDTMTLPDSPEPAVAPVAALPKPAPAGPAAEPTSPAPADRPAAADPTN